MSEIISEHEYVLRRLCRICGINIPINSKAAKKDSFLAEIKVVYGVDVNDDFKEVHPPNICNACRMRLRRVGKEDNEEVSVNIHVPPLQIFGPHGHDCELCHRKRGNPRVPKHKIKKTKLTMCKRKCYEHNSDSNDSSTDTAENSEPNEPKVKLSEQVEGNSVNFDETVIDSVSTDLFESDIAKVFICAICQGVPSGNPPVITCCEHMFCKSCISSWERVSPLCPVCRAILEDTDIISLHGHLLEIFETLSVNCKLCNAKVPLKNFKLHELHCKSTKTKRSVPIYDARKQAITSVSDRHLRHKRLKPVINFVDNFCIENNETKDDVLFFVLKDHLKQTNDKRFKEIDRIWHESSGVMSGDECLALRVDLLQSKGSYASQYSYLSSKGINVFQPPSVLDRTECDFLPNNVTFDIMNMKNEIIMHQDSSVDKDNAFLDVLGDFFSIPDLPRPNCCGVRFSYPAAVARSLLDLESDISDKLINLDLPIPPDLHCITTIKDGGDGMGEVSVHKEKSLSMLPDKAFRFSFCIVSVETEVNGELITLYKNDKPNSVRTNRPLLEALADENFSLSNFVCTFPIEKERQLLLENELKLSLGQGKFQTHKFRFFNSMVDEKRDRADSGLQSSGSNFLCTMCYAERESCKSNLGAFEICRKFEETCRISEMCRVNPYRWNDKEMYRQAKGVKCRPLSQMQQIKKGIDATHADINMGQFFKKLIIREIAGVTSWEVKDDIKDLISEAEVKFDEHVKAECGINPHLMMPGNYARTLFNSPPSILLHLITNEERKESLSDIFNRFCKLRSVYRCLDPRSEMPEEVRRYKAEAVQMGELLVTKFEYVRWPNYLHKLIEHVQQLIEDPEGPGSIGAFSSEGNEGGNKLFRHFRKNLARRGSTLGGLKDVLSVQWLYSSRVLSKIAEHERRKNKCSMCYCTGHIRRNCPLNAPTI